MNDDLIIRAKEAHEARKCISCGKTRGLEEFPIDEVKTYICSKCLERLAKLINKPSKRGMYNKLQAFFEAIPQQQEQVVLNFSDFTQVMGHALPKTAMKDRTWWANTDSPQGSSWMAAGWKLENIYMNAEIVVFRRKIENPLKSIPKYIKALLDGAGNIMSPSTRVLIGWIRFCRKIGWYFEGTILYERGGLSLDSLSETERAEVGEDYAVCKREIMRYKNEKCIGDTSKEKSHAKV